MMARVTTPVEGFSGVVAGVTFADGAGETSDPNALNYFRRHGYGVGSKPAVVPGTDVALQGAVDAAAKEKADGGTGGSSTPAKPAAKKAAAKRAPAKKAAPKKKADKPATTK